MVGVTFRSSHHEKSEKCLLPDKSGWAVLRNLKRCLRAGIPSISTFLNFSSYIFAIMVSAACGCVPPRCSSRQLNVPERR